MHVSLMFPRNKIMRLDSTVTESLTIKRYQVALTSTMRPSLPSADVYKMTTSDVGMICTFPVTLRSWIFTKCETAAG